MRRTPIYIEPCTLRDYQEYKEECARARGWNEAMDLIFPEEAKKRKREQIKKELRVAKDDSN